MAEIRIKDMWEFGNVLRMMESTDKENLDYGFFENLHLVYAPEYGVNEDVLEQIVRNEWMVIEARRCHNNHIEWVLENYHTFRNNTIKEIKE